MSDTPAPAALGPAPSAPRPGVKTAEAAVERIRAWSENLRSIVAIAEAEVMEACHVIRREHPERDAFAAYVGQRLEGVITPAKAWAYADVWQVGRDHRPVRELALKAPRKAALFVKEFIDVVGEQQLPVPLDEDDVEIARILMSPPRKFREKLRGLVAARRESRDHHPDDLRRLEELEAERDERARAEAAETARRTRADRRKRLRELAQAYAESAAEVLHDIEEHGRPAASARGHIELSNDIVMTALQSVAAAIFEEPE